MTEQQALEFTRHAAACRMGIRVQVTFMATLSYLAYGSNLWPPRLIARVGPVATVARVRLEGWALCFDKRGADGSGKCTLEARPDSESHGVIYTLSGAACATLDRIEGVGHGYAGHWLEIENCGPCYVYLAAARWRERDLLPFEWYKALVVAGARHHGFPAAYLSQIEAVAAVPDADGARAAYNLGELAVAPAARGG